MVDVNVNDKTALITGGTRGIGYFIAESFILNGISPLVITSRKPEACENAKTSLQALAEANNKPIKIIAMPCDVSSESDLTSFFNQVKTKISKLDILIANAGATYGAPLNSHPISAVKKVLDLNIVGVFQTIQLFAPLLEKSATKEDPSRIIIIYSVASLVATDFGGTYGYLATKDGISHLGKNLAIQLGPRNINVNIITPGFFATKMTNFLINNKNDELTEGNPLGRHGNKSDTQNSVLWLCSKHSNYINGVVLAVDGGLYLIGTSNLSARL